MAPKKQKIEPSVADKLLEILIQAQKDNVIDLSSWKISQHILEKQKKQAISPEALTAMDPAFGVYAIAHNKMIDLVDILENFPQLSRYINTIVDAQDEFMPSGPPMSPVTNSCFSSWSNFDLCFGRQESMVDIVKKVGLWAGLHPSYGPLYHNFSKSRLGLYLHEGCSNGLVNLTEIATGKTFTCIVSSGDKGRKGVLWLTRILPSPFPPSTTSVVYGTPYQLINTSPNSWLEYLERTYPKTKKGNSEDAHYFLMKYGLTPCYWLDYIMDSYVNHTPNLIYITGIPDLPESLPHSMV